MRKKLPLISQSNGSLQRLHHDMHLKGVNFSNQKLEIEIKIFYYDLWGQVCVTK
jgi:hypothetical protein